MPLFIILGYSPVLALIFRLDTLPVLYHITMLLLAFFIYSFLCLIVFDIVRVSLFVMQIKPPLLFKAMGILVSFCMALIIVCSGAIYARTIHTTKYTVNVNKPGAEKTVRLVLVSDLHIGATVGKKWIGRVVDEINNAEPDIVCIAGDIFDGNLDAVRDRAGIAAELRRIRSRRGVFAALGNHDIDRGALTRSGGGMDSAAREQTAVGGIAEILHEAGVILLRDEVREAAPGFWVAGRKDLRPIGLNGQPRMTAAALTALHGEPAGFLAVIDHQPYEFKQVEAAGADLLLCGHTHKGQIFPGSLITRRIYQKAGAAHYGYVRGPALQAIVTSGAGVWGPPIRVATKSEIAVIDLQFQP
jgi:predicted MPP superfamily phosphohydrolase